MKKTGRPEKTEQRDELVHVGFKADTETLDAIDVLVAEQRKHGGVSPKSAAIRGGLKVAADLVRSRASSK